MGYNLPIKYAGLIYLKMIAQIRSLEKNSKIDNERNHQVLSKISANITWNF